MSEKKVGKRLLTWVLVLVMTLSLLPLNVLADEVNSPSPVRLRRRNPAPLCQTRTETTRSP